MEEKQFWNPPRWKWGVFIAIIAFSVLLISWRPTPAPPPKVELLPFKDSPPAWDGSYPYLVISQLTPSKYKTSILMRKPTLHHDFPVNEFDVDLHTGRFILRQTDLFTPDAIPLSLTRTYIAWDYHSRAFGVGTNHPYDVSPTGTRLPYTYMDLNLEDFYAVHMPRISKGTGYEDAVFRHDETSSEFYGAQVAWNGNGWTLTLRDGGKVYFPEAYHAKNFAQGAAIEMIDAEGRRLHLKRDKVRNLQELISPGGRTMTFKYDNADRIVEAADDTGKVLQYTYDPGGHVQTVSESGKTLYHFQYESLMNYAGYDPWLLTEILDGKGNLILRNTFHLGRVSEQTLADGQVFHYEYRLERTGKVLQTTVLLPSGEKKVFSFQDGILIHQS